MYVYLHVCLPLCQLAKHGRHTELSDSPSNASLALPISLFVYACLLFVTLFYLWRGILVKKLYQEAVIRLGFRKADSGDSCA